uniref:BHLH domain-containing protein n=1 Tax=Chenopodium quinoa TaxID=63459 RepID=A0A803MH28_CHEQI
MAEEYCGGANWWDSTTSTNRSRFDGGSGGGGRSSSTSSTTTLANSGGGAGYGWLTDGPTAVDTKLDASSLQLVGLGLSSQAMAEWNQQQTAILPNFFSSLQGAQLPNMPTFEEKPKTTMEVRDTSSMTKKSGSENNNKRARNDGASSTLPPFKVRKEKMGDRITALQQLVSPFGKTDTASVLSEAIEYIKFLHEQVSVLSNPYLKSGGSYQQHQPGNEKAKIDPDGPKQDLRSRGLCLVPVSSTFPVTHETTVDFWTPTFGGTFR